MRALADTLSCSKLPWVETLAISAFPLVAAAAATAGAGAAAAAGPGGVEAEGAGGEVNVHDDLSREMSFYQCALRSVGLAHRRLTECGIPFVRPEDFFAEMIKTDTQMEKVKAQLLFEERKMSAYEERRRRQDERKFAKGKKKASVIRQALTAEDAEEIISGKRERAEDGRGGAGGGRGAGGPSAKRARKNEKYGYGGPKRHLKANNEVRDGVGSFLRGRNGGRNRKKKPNRPGKAARDKKRSQTRG